MSIVACRVSDDGYQVSADSISVRWMTQQKGERTKCAKLVEVNELIIGGVGFAEECILMQMFAETTKPVEPTARAVLEFLNQFAAWKNIKTGKGGVENEYILGVQNKAFRTHGYMVDEIKSYEAIGAGSDFALAAMYLGEGTVAAVGVATELSVFCEEPIITFKRKFKS